MRAVFEAITAGVHQNLIHEHDRHAGGHVAGPGRHIASQLPHHAYWRWAPGSLGAAAGAARAQPRRVPQAGAPLLTTLSAALGQDSSLSGTAAYGLVASSFCKYTLSLDSCAIRGTEHMRRPAGVASSIACALTAYSGMTRMKVASMALQN